MGDSTKSIRGMSMERRTSSGIDLGKEISMSPVETQKITDKKLKRIAWLSQQNDKRRRYQ
jgi:hypothetical protein